MGVGVYYKLTCYFYINIKCHADFYTNSNKELKWQYKIRVRFVPWYFLYCSLISLYNLELGLSEPYEWGTFNLFEIWYLNHILCKF